MMRLLRCVLAMVFALAVQRGAFAGQAEHVVVLVWDGMRPDFVRLRDTPTLYELAARGVFFQRHHSSYVTSTEVNGAALATGMYPAHSGILANVEYRPDLSWLTSYGTEGFDAVRRGDFISGGRYLGAATVAEILQQAGFPTIIAGAKPLALLHDRAPNKLSQAQKDSVTLFRGKTLPRSVLRSLVDIPEIGPFPSEPAAADSTGTRIKRWLKNAQNEAFNWLYGKPKTPPISRRIDAWTTKALVRGLWKSGVPKYTLLWLSEPDASQHQSGVGSKNAEAAMELCDKNLALVLNTLQDKALLERTDVLVVSDHGFSTIDCGIDLVKSLKRAKFIAGTQFDNPEPGDVMVVNLGGSAFFYVFGHDAPTIRRLVEFLQSSDFAGVIFSAIAIEGTFPLSQVRLDAPQGAPDVAVSMRWTSDRNASDAPGLVIAPDGLSGRGTHASLSPFDLHNTLIAAGPDFKKGFVSEVPSGNVDVAPTVLAILGVPPPSAMDGRVLSEAMIGGEASSLKPEEQTVKAERDLGFRVWSQYLQFTRVGRVVYFDQGNGESRLK
jgi:arylsulfatase A-like enzyme